MLWGARSPRACDLRGAVKGDHDEAARLRAQLEVAWSGVRAEKLGQLAGEFDTLHSIEPATWAQSTIVPASRLRPYLIDAVQRGMQRTLDGDRKA